MIMDALMDLPPTSVSPREPRTLRTSGAGTAYVVVGPGPLVVDW
jgi:hypothetical protein